MRTLFMYIQVGQKFTIAGDKMIRRKESKQVRTFCQECNKEVGANAILQGVKLEDATRLTFVHMCPMDYVWTE